jgi:prepilin peptidase CpaA
MAQGLGRCVHQSLPIEGLIGAGLALLLFSGLHDFAVRTVPNWVSLLLFGVGIVLRLIEGGVNGLSTGLAIALAMLMLTFVFWRLGWMGGGDVKMLTAAAIFVRPDFEHMPLLISGTAIAGGVLSLIYVVGGALVERPRGPRPSGFLRRALRCEQWRLSRRGPLPYAAAIAAGGWIATLHA